MNAVYFIVNIISGILISTEAQYLLETIKNDDLIMRCMTQIWKKYSESYTFAITSINNFSEKFYAPILLYTETKFTISKLFGKFNMFILILENTTKLEQIFESLYHSMYWNSRAKYLVAYYGNIDDINAIFNISWKYMIFNISIIAYKNLDTNVYTFFPYEDDNCAEFVNYERISSCSNDHLMKENIFPLKIPLDLHGCGVKLMPFIIPPFVTNVSAPREDPALAGLEITITHVISQRMNFTENYIANPHVHWGYKYNDGSYSLMFKSLYDRDVDLIFGFIYGNFSYIFDFDPSFCHLTDKSVWFFPTALQQAQWKNLTAIFEPRLWLVIFLMIIINGIFWWIVGRNREQSDEFNELTLCLMQSLYTLLQGSVIPPKRGNLRMIFVLWLISCLLIFTAHQCQLISILTNPIYDKQMQTLEDLISSKSKFGFYPTILDAYVNNSNPLYKAVINQYETCPLTAECLNRTAFKRDFAVVKNIRQVRYLMPRIYTFSNGRRMLYESEETAFQTLPRYHAVKGFPLLDRFDNLLMLLESNGLIHKWDVDSQFKVLKLKSEPAHEPLSLGHLQGAFLVWVFGMAISIFVLVCEKLYRCLTTCKLFQTN